MIMQFPPRERLVSAMTEGYRHGVPAMDAALQSLLREIPIAEMTYAQLHHYLVKLRDTYER